MKVIQVYKMNPFHDKHGGGVRYVNNLIGMFEKDDSVEQIIFLGQGGGQEQRGKVKYIPVSKSQTPYVFYALMLFKFSFMKDLNGSIVHTHRAYYSIPFGMFKWINKCRLISSLHGRTFEVFKENKRNKIITEATLSFFKMIERYALFVNDHLAPVSQDVVNSFSQKYKSFPSCNYTIIPSMVNTKFSSTKKVLKKDNQFCMVGRLSDVKDYDFIINLVLNHINYFRENNVTIKIAGDGEKKNYLLEKVNTSGIDDVILFLGPVFGEDLEELYKSSKALILCSKHEASPTVVIESLATDTPVISNDVGDVRETIISDKIGIVVDKNENDYLFAIKKIINGFDFDSSISDEVVLSRTSKNVCKKFLSLYDKI